MGTRTVKSPCAPGKDRDGDRLGLGGEAARGHRGSNGSPFFFGWWVLAAAFVIVMLGYSMRYSFSVFYSEILNEFGWSRAKTAAAFSLSMIVYGISSPIVGTLVDRIGPRRLLVMGSAVLAAGLFGMSQMQSILFFYLCFGLVMAVGINSLGFPTHHAYLPNWFVLRRGLALGILTAGQGASIILVSRYQYLVSIAGWRTALIILALMTATAVIPLAVFLIRRSPGEIGLLPDTRFALSENPGAQTSHRAPNTPMLDKEWTDTAWTLAKAMATHRFWGMFLTFLSYSVTYNLLMTHQPIYCQGIGFSPLFAASIYGLVGVTIIMGNLSNFVSDRIGRENTYILGTAGTLVAIVSLASASVSHAWLLYVYAVFFGFFFGIGSAASFSAAADLFAGAGYGSIIGFIILGFGLGGAIGPWLGGFIFDTTHTYTTAFMLAGLTMSLSCASLLVAAPRKIRRVAG